MLKNKNRKSIRLLVSISLASALAMVLAVCLLSFLALSKMTRTVEETIDEFTLEGRPLLELLQAIQKSDLEGHDYLTYNSSTERSEYDLAASKTITSFQSALKAPYADEMEKELVRRAFIKWKIAHNLTLSHPSAEDPAIQLKQMRSIDRQLDEIETALNKAISRSQKEIDELRDDSLSHMRMAGAIFAACAFIACIGCILLWRLLVRGIVQPIDELTANVKSLSAGAPARNIEPHRDDELGRLIRALNDMYGQMYTKTVSHQDFAEHDELTGLFNHRTLLRLLDDEIARCQRYSRLFSFILIDIDNFKDINDTYGQEAGDEVLSEIALMVSQSIRNVDKAARYGGDEIAVILPETSGINALAMAERIRMVVSSRHVSLPGGDMRPLKVSIGLAEYPGGKDSAKDLISAADDALYDAKRKGRNRVSIDQWLQKSIT